MAIKISAKSDINAVSWSLAKTIEESKTAEIQVIGAAALNTAIKSIIASRGILVPIDLDIVCIPSFFDTEINGEETTVIKIKVISKHYLQNII